MAGSTLRLPQEQIGTFFRRIAQAAVFKEDLRADSLHLVELVVELEDNYGVRIPDDEAAKLLTVGQTVDYIAAHAPETAS